MCDYFFLFFYNFFNMTNDQMLNTETHNCNYIGTDVILRICR